MERNVCGDVRNAPSFCHPIVLATKVFQLVIECNSAYAARVLFRTLGKYHIVSFQGIGVYAIGVIRRTATNFVGVAACIVNHKGCKALVGAIVCYFAFVLDARRQRIGL